jgi:hypothetical protein
MILIAFLPGIAKSSIDKTQAHGAGTAGVETKLSSLKQK